MGPKQSADSEPNWPSCSAGLALQQAGPALLDEAGVGCAALVTQDERLDVGDQFLLDSSRRDAPLEHHTDLLTGA